MPRLCILAPRPAAVELASCGPKRSRRTALGRSCASGRPDHKGPEAGGAGESGRTRAKAKAKAGLRKAEALKSISWSSGDRPLRMLFCSSSKVKKRSMEKRVMLIIRCFAALVMSCRTSNLSYQEALENAAHPNLRSGGSGRRRTPGTWRVQQIFDQAT